MKDSVLREESKPLVQPFPAPPVLLEDPALFELMGVAYLQSFHPAGIPRGAGVVWGLVLVIEIPRCRAVGTRRSPASDWSLAARHQTAEADRGGLSFLSGALPSLGWVAVGARDRQTRPRDWLAPQRISALLDMEGPARENRPAGGPPRQP